MKKASEKDGKFMDKLKAYFKRCGQDTPPFFKKLRTAGSVSYTHLTLPTTPYV